MRAPRAVIALAVLGLGTRPAAGTTPEAGANSLPRLRSLLRQAALDRQEAIHPQAISSSDPAAPVVTLGRLDDPLALERRLRQLVRAPYANLKLRVANGRAQLGHFSVGSNQTLAGDLLVVKGMADVYGRVTGNVVTLDGDIRVHRGAVIDGAALALGGQVRNLGGDVLGESLAVSAGTEPARPPLAPLAATGVRLAGVVGVFLTLALIGIGLVLFGRSNLETISDTAGHSVLRSFVVGLLSQVLIVPTFGMLVVGLVLSVVGVLLVPFVVIVYTLLVIVGIVGGFLGVAHALGESHTRRQLARGVALSPNSFRYLLLGLGAVASVWLAWAAFGWVPVAGGIVLAAAALATWLLATVGLGACVLSRAGVEPQFAGRYLPTDMLTDEYLWATPQHGVPAVKRPKR